MNTSTHYNLKLVEGTDLVNPLTVDVPNYQAIDSAMFANEQAGVGTATELKSGTIHAITRANENRNVFTFKSTSVFNVGDTFTVDGSSVTALYPDNSSLKERCFIVGSEVLCLLDGSQLTLLATYYPDASNVSYTNTGTGLSSTDVQGAITELTDASNIKYDTNTSVKSKISNLIQNLTVTKGSYLNNVDNVKAKVLDNSVLFISGVAYLNANVTQGTEILDFGKNIGSADYFGFIYSLTDGIKPVKLNGTKLYANVNINAGNLYMGLIICL